MDVVEGPADPALPAGRPQRWIERFRADTLSVGTYFVPAGGTDDQVPHTEDELYVVRSGRARLVTPTGAVDVGAGSVVFVPAGEEHRFTEVVEDLTVLVVFSPPEHTGR